jgi:hypothetical protein
MCNGPKPDLARQHKHHAQCSKILSIFYTLEIPEQKIFMAVFDQIVENNKEKLDNE